MTVEPITPEEVNIARTGPALYDRTVNGINEKLLSLRPNSARHNERVIEVQDSPLLAQIADEFRRVGWMVNAVRTRDGKLTLLFTE